MNRQNLEDELDILNIFHNIIHSKTLGIIPEAPIIRSFGHLGSHDAIDRIHTIVHERCDEINNEFRERFLLKRSETW